MKRLNAILFTIFIFLLLLSGCDMSTEPVDISYENVQGFESFAVPTAGTAIIKDETTWLRYWRDYWNLYNDSGKTPPPIVDFNKDMVIAIFYGNKYSGCSKRVEVIKDIKQNRGLIKVHLGPLPFLGVCRAIVEPIQMVKIPKSNLEVTFTGNVPK